MKRTIISLCAFLISFGALSQNSVDRLYLDTRTTFHQETEDGVYSSQIKGEYLNFHVLGHIGENIDYRLRQHLIKKVYDEKNMFNATDMLYINWRASERWSFLFGNMRF